MQLAGGSAIIIKICGIKTLAAALTAKAAGADLLGFVFAASKRKVAVEAAASICRQVPSVGKVGVFVNAPVETVNEIAQHCQLDYIQLHGDEPPDYAQRLTRPIIKAVKWHSQADLATIQKWPAEWLLLDSVKSGQFGGTGTAFCWQELADRRSEVKKKLIVAGGLTPENVAEAIMLLKPDGVDVSSGVETDGEKDPEKIYRFVTAARAAAK